MVFSAGAWPVESGMTGGGYLVYATKEEIKVKNNRMLRRTSAANEEDEEKHTF